MPDKLQNDHTVIAEKVKEQGADAVLISRLVSRKTVRTYVPGSVYYPPANYGYWHDYTGIAIRPCSPPVIQSRTNTLSWRPTCMTPGTVS